MSFFQPARRGKKKLRAAIDGPSGAGKTMTALRLASGLCKGAPGPKSIAVIDTERGSVELYQGLTLDGFPLEFQVAKLDSFSPSDYTAAIEAAGREGFDILVVDSLSHAWEGKDGALDLVDRTGKGFTAWKDVTPLHRRMVDAILMSPCHVICTMRSKTEYVQEKDESTGRTTVRKIGVAPIQRPGMEYEFDFYGSMDWSHIFRVTKSRCFQLDGVAIVKPTMQLGRDLLEWLNTGAEITIDAPRKALFATDDQLREIINLRTTLGVDLKKEDAAMFKSYAVTEIGHLSPGQAEEYLGRLAGRAKRSAPKATASEASAVTATAATAPAPTPTPTPKVEPTPKAEEATTPKAEATTPKVEAPATPKTEPSKNQKQPSGPPTLDNLAQKRGEWLAKAGIEDPDAIKTAWNDLLKPFGVTTAKNLDHQQVWQLENKLTEMIRELDKEAQLQPVGSDSGESFPPGQ